MPLHARSPRTRPSNARFANRVPAFPAATEAAWMAAFSAAAPRSWPATDASDQPSRRITVVPLDPDGNDDAADPGAAARAVMLAVALAGTCWPLMLLGLVWALR